MRVKPAALDDATQEDRHAHLSERLPEDGPPPLCVRVTCVDISRRLRPVSIELTCFSPSSSQDEQGVGMRWQRLCLPFRPMSLSSRLDRKTNRGGLEVGTTTLVGLVSPNEQGADETDSH